MAAALAGIAGEGRREGQLRHAHAIANPETLAAARLGASGGPATGLSKNAGGAPMRLLRSGTGPGETCARLGVT
jgi:hypothetical protein